MEAAIRFSQNSPSGSNDQRFLRVDATGKSFSLCQVTGLKRKKVNYDVVHTSSKVPAFRTFDWHPVNESLIAVGQSGGEATLLNIADGYQDSISFSVLRQRLCMAVALSSENLIAVGLEKVRNDLCLNIWDLSQRLPTGNSRSFSKKDTEPLHKLAGGETITSLKFFSKQPQLLAAGVKGQFVRLYDLREPNTSNGLQFSTRCVHNMAIDYLDDNYFASCLPASEALVCIWDRRMISRNNTAPVGFNGNIQSEHKLPEVSLEIKSPMDGPGTIWSLRFAKSKRGCLGIMSSNGQLKACDFISDHVSEFTDITTKLKDKREWYRSEPLDVFLDNARDVSGALPASATSKEQKQRIVSFDFTTSNTKYGEPKVMVLTGDGDLRMTQLNPPPEPMGLAATGFICSGSNFMPGPVFDPEHDAARSIDRIRRAAEPRNSLRQAFKQSKQSKSSAPGQQTDLKRMSSFSNHCWNTDLGYTERGVSLDDLLKLLSFGRLRCQSGYLLNPAKNKSVVNESQWLQSYWSFIERAERVGRDGGMIQDNFDLSYIGVFSIWMEEIATKPRLVGECSLSKANIMKNLVQRLNIPVRRLHPTEYMAHRQLCLHICGLAWSHEELENIVKKLVSGNSHTQAAAIALFASDDKLAYQALRSKSSAQTHKMLAMALAGSKQRRKRSASSSGTEDSATEADDEWTETISSLSSDLTDPYARAILAYVKSGDWLDVLEIDALPLKHRVGIAIRHLDDNDLTAYIGQVTRQVIETGDIEGIILTGIGTTEGLGLLSSYVRDFYDLQSAILGLSIGGAAERFIVHNDERDAKAKRSIEAFRETYRSQIMQWNLKFDRVRFDVTSSKALSTSQHHRLPRPKEQVRLVCTFCSGSLTQFPSNGTSSSTSTPGIAQGSGRIQTIETAKHPLTADKAAVLGTVCPKCGRHLPRCGVCDLWLGMPDDTHARWFTAQLQQNNKSVSSPRDAISRIKRGSTDLTASMSGSVVTATGPMTASSATIRPNIGENGQDDDNADDEIDVASKQEGRWHTNMQHFTVFCITCGHGFHAAHARLWFDGKNGQGGHRICPVPGCDCRCNG